MRYGTGTRTDAFGEAPHELHGDGRFVMSRKDFVPAYVRTHDSGELGRRVEASLELLRSCTVCPRHCGVDRVQNATATCHTGRRARVSGAFAHVGEEDCLRGTRGSGTIFFAWCNLRCVFCQNYETSQDGEGSEVTAEELAAIMVRLQEVGCHNINFVTPEHVVPQILEALPAAIEGGLRLPLVYNTGAYDSLDSLRLMDGVVDVYMPDFKLWEPAHTLRYLLAKDYPAVARQAIVAMHGQVGDLKVDAHGLALRGVLIRHLVMPGLLEDTRSILGWLADAVSRDTYVNVMDQYRPAWRARTDARFHEIGRRITEDEFAEAIAAGRRAGLWRFDTRGRQRPAG